mgnify:CR=1 FL=1
MKCLAQNSVLYASAGRGVSENPWLQICWPPIMVGMNLNFDGLKDAVIRMLAGDKVQINTGTFSNDMTTFQGMDDVLTLLVHLGYLSYHWPDRTVTIPNKEMYKCFNKTAHLYH